VAVKVLRGNDLPLGAFTVDYATSDGSATNGMAYTATTGTLAFAQGETVKTVTVPILYHEQLEPDRQFKLTLRNATGGVPLGTNTTATITILDTTGLKPHRFEGVAALPDGSVRLTLGGGVSQRFKDYCDLYPIEVSSNLLDWVPLVTLQRTNALTNALTYTDTATANWPVRFYRTPSNHLITPFTLKPTGPYPVGVLSRKLTDPSRPNRYRLWDDGSFMVSVWYPAMAQAGRWPGPLLDAQMAQDPFFADQLHNAGYPGTNIADRAPWLVGYALPDAPIATNLAPCPILLCTPQGYGWRASLAEKAANFASQGYVVVVSDPCDGNVTVFPDGTYLKLLQTSWPPRSDCVDDRVRDLAFMLDELTRWNATDPMFAGRLDVTKVAAMGTCTGFDAAAEFAFVDRRCQAAILVSCTPARWVAPWSWGGGSFPALDQSGLGKPQLVVFGDYSDAFSYYDFLYNKATKDATVFQIRGVGNAGYYAMILVQDFYLLLEPYRQAAGKEGARTITDYSLWFLNKYLKGSSDPMPPLANYPSLLGFKQK
jgi:predicted dienelactone hydrolase